MRSQIKDHSRMEISLSLLMDTILGCSITPTTQAQHISLMVLSMICLLSSLTVSQPLKRCLRVRISMFTLISNYSSMYLAHKKNMIFRIPIMMIRMNGTQMRIKFVRNHWLETLKSSKQRNYSYGFLKQIKFIFSEMRLLSIEIRLKARDSTFTSQI